MTPPRAVANVLVGVHDGVVLGFVVLGALLVGGIIGAVLNRRWPRQSGPPTQRTLDSADIDVQAGFRNIHGGP